MSSRLEPRVESQGLDAVVCPVGAGYAQRLMPCPSGEWPVPASLDLHLFQHHRDAGLLTTPVLLLVTSSPQGCFATTVSR